MLPNTYFGIRSTRVDHAIGDTVQWPISAIHATLDHIFDGILEIHDVQLTDK